MKLVSLASLSIFAMVGLAQTPPAPKPAAAKPAAAKPVAAKPVAASPVDSVIQSLKAGLSETLIIRTLKKDNKPLDLTPADLVKLKNAGVSENIISVMLDPASAPAPAAAAAPPPPPAPEPAPVAMSAPPPSAPTAGPSPKMTLLPLRLRITVYEQLASRKGPSDEANF